MSLPNRSTYMRSIARRLMMAVSVFTVTGIAASYAAPPKAVDEQPAAKKSAAKPATKPAAKKPATPFLKMDEVPYPPKLPNDAPSRHR